MAMLVPVRVLLKHQGISRKFFTLLESRDGSLYIHPNRPSEQPWKAPGTSHNNSSELLLDFEESIEPDFKLNKISFHQSGYIHLTNDDGKRYRDGIKGTRFTDITSPYLLCSLIPCELKYLPEFKEDKKCMAITLEMPDGIQPFYLTLSLLKSNHEVDGFNETMLMPPIVLPLKNNNKLSFVLRSVVHQEKGELLSWPSFPFFLYRTGA